MRVRREGSEAPLLTNEGWMPCFLGRTGWFSSLRPQLDISNLLTSPPKKRAPLLRHGGEWARSFSPPCLRRGGTRLLRDGVVKSLAVLSIIFLFLTVAPAQSTSNDWPQTEARLTALLAGNSEQKRTALAEIRNIRSEQASRLAIPVLSDKDEIVRATAAGSVIFLSADAAVPALLPLLDDKRPFVRREAAYALGQVGHSSANQRLLRSMSSDRDLEVRAAAAAAIGNIGDPASMEGLLSVLGKRPRQEEEFLRRSAARAIGQIFEYAATGRTATLTPQNFLPPKFKDVEAVNSPMLKDLRSLDRVSAQLTKIIQDRSEADDTRREAAFALGAMRRPESAALLRSLLTSPDPYLVEISKEALLKIGSQE